MTMEIGLRESLMIFGVIVLAVVLIDGVRMMRRRQKELKLRIGKGIDVDQFDDDEMRKITSQRIAYGSKWRNLDYLLVSSPEFKKALVKNNIKLVDWKQIKNLMYPSN